MGPPADWGLGVRYRSLVHVDVGIDPYRRRSTVWNAAEYDCAGEGVKSLPQFGVFLY